MATREEIKVIDSFIHFVFFVFAAWCFGSYMHNWKLGVIAYCLLSSLFYIGWAIEYHD